MISTILENAYMSRVKWVKLKRMLSLPRSQKVLDVGGGDGPFPRADVICEKFIADDAERARKFLRDRPLVIGDIESLPFKDKAFDFIYCSHVLEHVEDPSRAIREITRVAERGFIEVPSEYMELTGGSRVSHLWTIRQDRDGTLVFSRKKAPSPNPLADEIYQGRLRVNNPLYMAFHWKNYYSLFNIGLVWEKTIPHKILPFRQEEISDHFEKGGIETVGQIQNSLGKIRQGSAKFFDPRTWVKKLIQTLLTNRSTKEWFFSSLACPSCKKMLEKKENFLLCPPCNVQYPLAGDTPLLLSSYAGPASVPDKAESKR